MYIYIRLRYGFWYYQPVFHVYDLYSYIFPCGIIMHDLPKKNRYTNFQEITTLHFDTIRGTRKMTEFANLIQFHFLRNKENRFTPKKRNLIPYFLGYSRNHPCFISFYYEDELLHDIKNNTMIPHKKLIGAMTTRPLHVFIKNKNAQFYVYYVDYLCVDKSYRKKGIAPQLIQTHEYNQRHGNDKISVSLFKREGQLTGIVPLCVYMNYGFPLDHWLYPEPLVPRYNLIECTKQNIRFLMDFMKQERDQFDICITAELASVISLINSYNLHIYFLLDTENSDILAAYYFKKTCVSIQHGKDCVCCFASIQGKGTKDALFIEGFGHAIASLRKYKYKYSFLSIESISHNIKIINHYGKANATIVSPVAYFFYNFAYHTFHPRKVFVLGS